MVGAPCGVMDQMAAAVGQAGCLMALTCQPALVQSPLPLVPSFPFCPPLVTWFCLFALTGQDWHVLHLPHPLLYSLFKPCLAAPVLLPPYSWIGISCLQCMSLWALLDPIWGVPICDKYFQRLSLIAAASCSCEALHHVGGQIQVPASSRAFSIVPLCPTASG